MNSPAFQIGENVVYIYGESHYLAHVTNYNPISKEYTINFDAEPYPQGNIMMNSINARYLKKINNSVSVPGIHAAQLSPPLHLPERLRPDESVLNELTQEYDDALAVLKRECVERKREIENHFEASIAAEVHLQSIMNDPDKFLSPETIATYSDLRKGTAKKGGARKTKKRKRIHSKTTRVNNYVKMSTNRRKRPQKKGKKRTKRI